MTPAGWYPDPAAPGGQRYFDGARWTEHRIAAPKQPAWQRGPWPWVVAGVAVLVMIGLVIVSANTHPMSTPVSDAADTTTTVGMNQTAADGKFSFKVTAVNQATTLGSQRPRGKYVVVTVSVKNTGREPQSFFVHNQKLLDGQGTEFAADGGAAYSANDDSPMILDMNPGIAATVRIPFDVPQSVNPTAIQLHDSAFSGGVTVRLS